MEAYGGIVMHRQFHESLLFSIVDHDLKRWRALTGVGGGLRSHGLHGGVTQSRGSLTPDSVSQFTTTCQASPLRLLLGTFYELAHFESVAPASIPLAGDRSLAGAWFSACSDNLLLLLITLGWTSEFSKQWCGGAESGTYSVEWRNQCFVVSEMYVCAGGDGGVRDPTKKVTVKIYTYSSYFERNFNFVHSRGLLISGSCSAILQHVIVLIQKP